MKKMSAINYDNIILSLLSLYIFLKPLYIFEELPFQISDLLMLINLFILSIVLFNQRNKVNDTTRLIVHKYFYIVIYQLMVNVLAYFILEDKYVDSISLLMVNLYYLFNLLAVFYIGKLLELYGNKVLHAFMNGITLSMILIGIGLFVNLGLTSRNASFFRNPNQLGYYALLALTAVTVFSNQLSYFKRFIIYMLSGVSILLSGSKAAVLGVVVLIICKTFQKVYRIIVRQNLSVKCSKKIFIIVLSLVCISLIYVVLIWSNIEPYVYNLIDRIYITFDTGVDLGSSRGYARIYEMIEFIIFGVGEGAFSRFYIMTGNETHSSYATIIISYGITGIILYISLFKNVIQKAHNINNFLISFSAVFCYWMSHNGLRNTLFWMIILMFSYKLYDNYNTKS